MSHAQAAEQSHLLRLQISIAQAFNMLQHSCAPITTACLTCLTLQVFEATGQQKQQGRQHE